MMLYGILIVEHKQELLITN